MAVRSLTIIFVALVASAPLFGDNTDSKEAEVIKTVELFFTAMAEKDTAGVLEVWMPDGQYHYARQDSSGFTTRMGTIRGFIETLSTLEDDILERMWDPKVLIHDRVAVLWAKYDFHQNGLYSHGGIDAFSLIKTREGWKITSAVWSVEFTGFEKSPLGPVGEGG